MNRASLHSGIVTRPYSRLPLRGQHRNKVTTRLRKRFDFGSPSYRYYRRRVAAVLAVRVVTRTCFPLNPPEKPDGAPENSGNSTASG